MCTGGAGVIKPQTFQLVVHPTLPLKPQPPQSNREAVENWNRNCALVKSLCVYVCVCPGVCHCCSCLLFVAWPQGWGILAFQGLHILFIVGSVHKSMTESRRKRERRNT